MRTAVGAAEPERGWSVPEYVLHLFAEHGEVVAVGAGPWSDSTLARLMAVHEAHHR